MNPTEIETLAFEYFCVAHPHEAAELDWPAFLAFTRRESGMNLSEYEIRQCLVETQDKPTSKEGGINGQEILRTTHRERIYRAQGKKY